MQKSKTREQITEYYRHWHSSVSFRVVRGSGVYTDLGSTKASGVPGVLLSVSGAKKLTYAGKSYYLVLFKDGVKVIKAEAEIKKAFNIQDNRVGRNDHLLAVIGQSTNKTAVGIYQTGAILFCMVLIAGITMIYNTFNISVMERIRQFGLCGASGIPVANKKDG